MRSFVLRVLPFLALPLASAFSLIACAASNAAAPAPETATVPAPPPPSRPTGLNEGAACKKGESACRDAKTALYCVDGSYVAAACGGADGCTFGDQAECDNRISHVGDACIEENDLACTSDARAELRCRKGHFVLASTCRGPTGCYFTTNKLHCDTDLADLPDPCEDEGDLACALDKKSLYKCNGSKYVVESTCRGPNGCAIAGTVVKCDHHSAEAGDACHSDGNFACNGNGDSLLVCKGNRFTHKKTCSKGPCTFEAKGDTTEFDCP